MKDRLKELRKSLKLTQKDFAETINISKSAIESYEYGRNTITDRTISDICRVHDVNEEWLRNGTGDMFIPKTTNQTILSYVNKVLSDNNSQTERMILQTMAELPREHWGVILDIIRRLSEQDQE